MFWYADIINKLKKKHNFDVFLNKKQFEKQSLSYSQTPLKSSIL